MRACLTHPAAFRASGKPSPACEPTGVVTFVQAMLLAVLQGVSELFPVSSLGPHRPASGAAALERGRRLGIVPRVRRRPPPRHGARPDRVLPQRLDRDHSRVRRKHRPRPLHGRPRRTNRMAPGRRHDPGRHPRRAFGILRKKTLRIARSRCHCSCSRTASSCYWANGYAAASTRRRTPWREANAKEYRRLDQLTPRDGVFVGFAQSLALLPGISRSGSAIVAGLLRDLHHEDAARYSFLLATPVILAASLLEFPKLFAPDAHVVLVQAVVGGIVAGITAYASVAFLTRYFRHNDLSPFAWYCIAAGAVSFILFATKVIA